MRKIHVLKVSAYHRDRFMGSYLTTDPTLPKYDQHIIDTEGSGETLQIEEMEMDEEEFNMYPEFTGF